VAGYRVYRRAADPENVYGFLYAQPASPGFTDDFATPRLLFYRVRAYLGCLGVESAD
jgi:hypothetical protein